MTERERLIKLLDQNCGYVEEQKAETLADYLLENYVIVSPCKVGDTVYKITNIYTECSLGVTPRHEDDYKCVGCCKKCDSVKTRIIDKGKVIQVLITEDNIKVCVEWESTWDNSFYIVGDKVWKSYEEAEKVLKESDK